MSQKNEFTIFEQKLKNILFVNIETVSLYENVNSLDERLIIEWKKKASKIADTERYDADELFKSNAGIYAEFGKIIVIGLGFFNFNKESGCTFRVKILKNDDEKILLLEFCSLIAKMSKNLKLCGHNVKEFDLPFLSRRMLINDIKLPHILNTATKKPWETNHLDTMEMWKFGDRKNYSSLDLLATIFNIESSKKEMSGEMVSKVYYQEKNIDKIASYCIRDIVVVAKLYLKLNSIPLQKFETVIN